MIKIEIEGRVAECEVVVETKWNRGRVAFLTPDTDWSCLTWVGHNHPQIGDIVLKFDHQAVTINPWLLAILLGDRDSELDPLFDQYAEWYEAGKVKDHT